MPRNIQKISNLQEIINEQAQKIAKYEQLIANINGLIKISQGENSRVDLLADQFQIPEEQIEALVKEHNKEVYRKLIKRGEQAKEQSDETKKN